MQIAPIIESTLVDYFKNLTDKEKCIFALGSQVGKSPELIELLTPIWKREMENA